MDLQADESGLLDGVVVFGVVDGLEIVDPKLNAFAFAADTVVVPVFAFENLVQLCFVGPGQNLAAPRFVVETAPVLLSEVRLVADHFVRRVVDALAADLDAGVCVLTLQHELQAEFEVAVLIGCCQEIVVRDFFV